MRGVLDRRRIGAGARLPLWCAAALLACVLFSASGCAGCSADADAGDLLATTEQAQQAARADGEATAGAGAEASAEDGAEPGDETPEGDGSAADRAEADSGDAAQAEPGAGASGASGTSGGSKSSGGSGASKSRSGAGAGAGSGAAAGSNSGSSSGAASAAAAADPAPAPSSGAASDAAPEQPGAISVEVVFDSSNAAKFNPKFPSSLGTFTVELPAGATVYDALVATGVAFTTKGGNYIDSIGGIAEKQCGAGSGWMYAVNGKFPGKSAMKLELASGDEVRWAYTVTMGDV